MRLNLTALNDPDLRTYMIDQVVPHEMAHIAEYQLYNEAGHGFRWKLLCSILGIPADRTHNLPLRRARKTIKFMYNCKDCGTLYWLGKNRHNQMQRKSNAFICRHCQGLLIFQNETKVRQ